MLLQIHYKVLSMTEFCKSTASGFNFFECVLTLGSAVPLAMSH